MAITMPSLDVRLSSNYTKGRQGTPVRKITFHHVVGSALSAVTKALNDASDFSPHFVCGGTKIYCCVDTDNTAWTNANWASNLESVTIEFEGDWRNGYRNEAVLNNGVKLVAWLRTIYPGIGYNRHRDVAPTACPSDFPVEEVWNRATQMIAAANQPVPVQPPAIPPTPALKVIDIQNKIVITNKDANLWDLTFTTWATAKSIKVIPKGTEVEVSATAAHQLGGTYYLAEYSYSKGIMNGINVADCTDKVVVVPPVVPPVTPPVIPPVEPPVEPEPDRNAIIAFLVGIRDAITAFLSKFKK